MSNRFEGVRVAVNREISMSTIINQLPDLDEKKLKMVAEYIWGLKAADVFMNK